MRAECGFGQGGRSRIHGSGARHLRRIPYPAHVDSLLRLGQRSYGGRASGDRDGRALSESILNAVGRSWKPFVQVRSHKNGHEENVFVYMRQEGRDWKLLVTAVERDEATVVQLKLNADALARWVASPEHCARHWNGEITE
jgi:hypothetical protein